MSRPIIEVKNVSKCYQLGAIGATRFRDDLERFWNQWTGKAAPATQSDFWALRDVSFEVQPGEVVGIIGRNGAGKSTLLKILSRITEPTGGEILLRGRVASLLEVGTGFHADLTGRENIFLNGAILGMTKTEIRSKLDEIIDFAEIEQFIDTPVKRYSSGMYVRLAFAVAAHLEPEILIVDEVLAVGDAQFQQKCLGKMQSAGRSGRTVLFVSHNMSAVQALCEKAVWLKKGTLFQSGPAGEITAVYMGEAIHSLSTVSGGDLTNASRRGSGKAHFTHIEIEARDEEDCLSPAMFTGSNLYLRVDVAASDAIGDANLAVTLYDANGTRLVDVNSALKGEFLSLDAGQKRRVVFQLEDLRLKPGLYVVELWLGRGGIEEIDCVPVAATVEIHPPQGDVKHTETFPGLYQPRFEYGVLA